MPNSSVKVQRMWFLHRLTISGNLSLEGRSRNCIPIHVPTAVKSGDSFSLVSPQGPKFYDWILESSLPKRSKSGKNPLHEKRLSGESTVQRVNGGRKQSVQRGQSFWSPDPHSLAQRAVVFVKSGAIYQPRNIFLGITLLGGYIFGGVTACNSRKTSAQLSTTTTLYKDCQKSNEYIKEMNETKDYSFGSVVYRLASPELSEALKDDSEGSKSSAERSPISLRRRLQQGFTIPLDHQNDAGPKEEPIETGSRHLVKQRMTPLILRPRKNFNVDSAHQKHPQKHEDFRVIKKNSKKVILSALEASLDCLIVKRKR